METLTQLIETINGWVWGPPMLILILGVGLFLSIGLKLMPILKLGTGFRLMWQGRASQTEDGEIPPFQALMTALSATVGTGNIAGVATAVFLGGPGALFWMWLTALVGMATKYSEAVLAVNYREVDERGARVGGPMYYIRNGLGARWTWMGVLFALFASIAAFGIGNTVQANSVADVLETNFDVPHWVTGITLATLVGLVLIGGIRRIGQVASSLVPLMAISYLVMGLIILGLNAAAVPEAMAMVFRHAFSPIAAQGGFAGAAVWAAIQFGVARGVFSNEAGLGSAPIAHAAAQTRSPIHQGMVAMLGTFLDTIVICTITGLVIITSGVWSSGESGAALTSMAFAEALPGVGNYLVAIALAVFAFTTTLGWSFYGERCVEFLFGVKAITPYRILWIVAIPVGATLNLGFVWLVADTLNAMMAIPNLVALALLSPVVFRLTRDFMASNGDGYNEKP
ncbi:AGCS family alanine or glycine:cation symporter [Tamilnaduibacter salinus]|uniref:AGCS family alanine or glycine:cation symporter n=1 Tax=Tamilnaduibacter salinus TaxID=1484056 RepID=A0A2U1CX51_9GAMM|nr:sodium:alanine symporter family protein [Tamilnaduibacter salinus]PVY76785.1 AGCS family alanine or glycine:cation symporter [Tamilnaduibacter salinus]